MTTPGAPRCFTLALLLSLAPLVAGCPGDDGAGRGPAAPTSTMNKRPFQAFAQRFLDESFELSPTDATRNGDHRFDTKWPDLSVQGDAAQRAFYQRELGALAALDKSSFDATNRVDAAIVENVCRYALFMLDEIKSPERDPVAVTTMLGDGLDPLVTRSFAPLGERAKSLRARLDGVGAVLDAAERRLGSASPEIFTKTAIQQNQGLIGLCAEDIPQLFDKLPKAEHDELVASAQRAAAAFKRFGDFLEKDLLPRSRGDFRLGRALFEKKLRFELDDQVDVDGIARDARELLRTTQAEMIETAKAVWPRLRPSEPLPSLATDADRRAFLKRALDAVASRTPDNATIVRDAQVWLDKATAFVKEHDLVTLPSEPCRVIEMPEYRRGVSVAYCDASGPLEQKQETFYAISPTPKDWKPERVASFYREYNASMLAELTVHEAMPGHFLQLMVNNRFDSKLRGVYQSGSFVEGWAVYSEWLMAKYGFGGPEVALMRQKMVLRLSVNAILDHGVHAADMDEKTALALMTNEAFQEEGEAVGKWRRACLSSAQLTTYYYGFTELMKLRVAAEKQAAGKPFSERAYHDRLLSYGSPPPRHARELMSGR